VITLHRSLRRLAFVLAATVVVTAVTAAPTLAVESVPLAANDLPTIIRNLTVWIVSLLAGWRHSS
jgi:hypothetical protein